MSLTTEFKCEFLPAARPSKKLMLVLHGKGDSSKPFRKFNEEINLPEMNYLLLNAPRKYMDGYSWYGDPPFQADAVPKMRERLMKVIDQLVEQGWDTKDIYVFGFSQGCLIGADLVLHERRDFAGFIGVSGYFHFYPGWRRELSSKKHRTPWVMLHGQRDRVLPIEDTRFGMEKIKSLGMKIDWHESQKGHSMDQDEADVIHAWLKKQLGR
ncbi:MAG: serine esterase [Bdellovibrionaceae bacterium]|nr:serine esterase [Pseudobdellovibrionaceae bacterium]